MALLLPAGAVKLELAFTEVGYIHIPHTAIDGRSDGTLEIEPAEPLPAVIETNAPVACLIRLTLGNDCYHALASAYRSFANDRLVVVPSEPFSEVA